MKRRRFVYAVVAGSGLVAGCIGDSGSGQSTPAGTEQSTTTTTDARATTTSTPPTTEEPTTTATEQPTATTETTTTTGTTTTTENPTTEPVTSEETSTADLQINANDQTISPGDTETITITGKNLASIRLSSEEGIILFNYNDVQTSPQISGMAKTDPPYLEWSSPPAELTVELPIRVPEDAVAGTYNYTVIGWHDSQVRDDSVTDSFTVTVETNDTDQGTPIQSSPTDGTPTTGDGTGSNGEVQRRVSLAKVDELPDDAELSIEVELLETTVTSDHTAHLRIIVTDETSEKRVIAIGDDSCGLFDRSKGGSEPAGLWLHRPDSTEYIERAGNRWTRDRNPEEPRGFGGGGCGFPSTVHDEPIVNEYLVWDDYQVEGYMTPDTYRFATAVRVGRVETENNTATTGRGNELEFTWGFNLAVETPNG